MAEKLGFLRSRIMAFVGLFLLVIFIAHVPVSAQEPSNKPAAMIARGDITFVNNGQTVEILSEIVKTSKPTDLILSVTAESSIITDVTTTGNDDQFARGQLEVYIEIDGQVVTPPANPLPPGPGNPPQGDTGAVVFANQRYQRITMLGTDDTNDTIQTFLETRHAAGFNWMALNVGSATHTIKVFARYTQQNSAAGNATGVIGNRSLVVHPVKSARNETITIN